jgi:hypothetical protein
MSLNNDYIISTLTNQKVNELHAQAANDRLVRIATEGRVPWWRRLLHDSAPSPTVQANGVRQPRPRRNHPATPAHHVARY